MPAYFASTFSIECHNVPKEFHSSVAFASCFLFLYALIYKAFLLPLDISNILRICEHCRQKASLWSLNKCSYSLQACRLAEKSELLLRCPHNILVLSSEHLLCFREKLWLWTAVGFHSECSPSRFIVFRYNIRHLQVTLWLHKAFAKNLF